MPANNTTTIYGKLPVKHPRLGQTSKVNKVYGFQFPIGKTTTNGFLPKIAGLELVKNNIQQLLLTERGQRVMLPNFGCNLKRYLFEPLDEQTFNSIKTEILTSIHNYAVGVEVIKLSVNALDSYGVEGLQAIEVKLTLKLSSLEDVVFDTTFKIE